MRLIIGLGNPGLKYSHTRHNAGRLLVEHIACRLGRVFFKKKSLQASVASLAWEGEDVILAYPEIFMNACGEAVGRLVRHYGIHFKKELLIAVDDLALTFGRLRLRGSGSDGGHNGLKSIHEALASQDYPRLRIGIGSAGGNFSAASTVSTEEFVLSPFDKREREVLHEVLEKGFAACRLWVSRPIAQAMNAINSPLTLG